MKRWGIHRIGTLGTGAVVMGLIAATTVPRTRADSPAFCRAPRIFTYGSTMPVDSPGPGVWVRAPDNAAITLERIDGDARTPEPFTLEEGIRDYGQGGLRIAFARAPAVGERFTLAVEGGCGPYEVDLGNAPAVVEFTIVEHLDEPQLPVPTTGPLEAFNHNGCATDARSYSLTVGVSNDSDAADTDGGPPERTSPSGGELAIDGVPKTLTPLAGRGWVLTIAECSNEPREVELRWVIRVRYTDIWFES